MATATPQTLPASIQQIIDQITAKRDTLNPGGMRKIVLDANVQMDELEPWADYDHPLADSYGRKLVYDDGFFEVMVMSWAPGDVSAIHDHGFTQWGAVQVFGPAEHATFLVNDDVLTTLARDPVTPGQVLGVGNRLVHQMANPSNERFLSLHVYGVTRGEGLDAESVTADARIWNLAQGVLERTSGGVFFALPDELINSRDAVPQCDFLSWLHDTTECLRRVRRARQESDEARLIDLEAELSTSLFNADRWDSFSEDLTERLDDAGHVTDSKYWSALRSTLQNAAGLQSELLKQSHNAEDSFHTYAELYDEVIGKQCLDSFTSKYIRFVHDKYGIDFAGTDVLSIGCGTGIMEEHILREYGVDRQRLLGIDISGAMVEVASDRIRAEQRDILADWGDGATYGLSFASLNVLQYLPAGTIERAIANTAALTEPGGWFVGDFITPDHVRWYPNVIASDSVISLRQPELIEENHITLQRSAILNVSRLRGELRITDEGRHARTLPPLYRVRRLFEDHFGKQVDVVDAVTLEPLAREADTAPSTRYLVIARKG